MKAAIRHLKRNRGRSILTLLAVLIPVYSLVVMFALAGGNLRDMFDTATRLDTGHLQIRHVEERGTGSAMPLIQDPAEILAALSRIEGIEWYTVRLDLPALSSVGERSQTIRIQGVIPEEIDPISPLRDLIIAGRYLSSADEGVIIGEELADLMKVGVGDEMILLGAHPETGLGVLKVPILGIYSAPAAAMGRTIVQAPLAVTRRLARGSTAATAVVVRVADVNGPWDVGRIDKVVTELRTMLPAGYEVLDWRELAPQVSSYMAIIRPALLIFAAIFFALGALVVLNTVYLSVMERTRELGLIIALGASRWRVIRMILVEAGLLSVMGAVYGALAGVALVWIVEALGGLPLPASFAAMMKAVGMNPVLHLRVSFSQVILSAVAMASVATIAAWYPARRASRLEPVEAMRYVE
jgi:ABC-type lipoprotein release transport system permease subunit